MDRHPDEGDRDFLQDWDIAFDVLRDSRRRYTLDYLSKHSEDVSISELADRIASVEADLSLTVLPEDHRFRVFVSLHHVHLPKLSDAGFIGWDKRERTITRTELADQLPTFTPVRRGALLESEPTGEEADD